MTRFGALASASLLFVRACAASAQDAADQRDCDGLFEKAVAQLANEQYARMQELATKRMRLCPGPKSALLVGLAQANRVDAGLIADPPEREKLRKSALRHLRMAATLGDALPQEWLWTISEWIVALQDRGPQGEPVLVQANAGPVYDAPRVVKAEPLEVPPAPPPQPQAHFPWGPLLTGVAGTGLFVTGVALALSANSRRSEAASALAHLREHLDMFSARERMGYVAQIRQLDDSGSTRLTWSAITLIGGGAALAAATAWYFAFPPDGKWRWAVAPNGLQASVRF